MAALPRESNAFVRLAPNTEYRAWGIDYVLVWPAGGAFARAHLVLRAPQAGTTATVSVDALVDLRARTATVGPGLPAAPAPASQQQTQRVLDLLLACRLDRRRGVRRPTTAYDRWIATKEQP